MAFFVLSASIFDCLAKSLGFILDFLFSLFFVFHFFNFFFIFLLRKKGVLVIALLYNAYVTIVLGDKSTYILAWQACIKEIRF